MAQPLLLVLRDVSMSVNTWLRATPIRQEEQYSVIIQISCMILSDFHWAAAKTQYVFEQLMVYSIKPDYVGLTLQVLAEPKCAQNCAQCVGLKSVTHTGWLSSFCRDLRSIRRQDAELIGQDEVIEV